MDRKTITRCLMNDALEERFWDECIFVFDTSALLNFYNYSPTTKDFLFKEVFPKFKGRLWLPNHVEYEYLKNRKDTLKNPIKEKYGKLEDEEIKTLKELTSKFNNQLISLKNKTKKKFDHPYFDQAIFEDFDRLAEKSANAFEQLILSVEKEIESRKAEIMSLDQKDDVLIAIETFFTVGKPFSFDQLINIAKEGEFRFKHKIPPGYEDSEAKKSKIGIQKFGDLIIWKQILEYARITTKPLVFITDDVKADWCYIEKRGSDSRITRPKEELIKEIFDFAAVDFWMYSLSQFVYNLEKYYSFKPDKEIITEIKLSANNEPLKYDKLYIAKGDKAFHCLKFFEDGEVISAAIGSDLTVETPEKVEKWFNKGFDSRGLYEIIENKIKFSIQTKYGNIDYEGVIDNDTLTLNLVSRINGYKGTEKYKLLETE